MAKFKADDTNAVKANWMRNRNTIGFLGIWETLYNPGFKPIEFDGIRKEAGLNASTMSPGPHQQITFSNDITSAPGDF
jgi:hypothetical protein